MKDATSHALARQVDTSTALPPTPDNYAGYVAQFGFKGSDNRSMIITRNEVGTLVAGRLVAGRFGLLLLTAFHAVHF